LKTIWDKLIFVLSLFGLGISTYLSYKYLTHTTIACFGGEKGCDIVALSPYASVFTIPVPLLGVAGYLLIFLLSLVRLFRGTSESQKNLASQALFASSLMGTLYSFYLTYLELFVIYAICTWCVASAVTMTLIFLLSLPLLKTSLIGRVL